MALVKPSFTFGLSATVGHCVAAGDGDGWAKSGKATKAMAHTITVPIAPRAGLLLSMYI